MSLRQRSSAACWHCCSRSRRQEETVALIRPGAGFP